MHLQRGQQKQTRSVGAFLDFAAVSTEGPRGARVWGRDADKVELAAHSQQIGRPFKSLLDLAAHSQTLTNWLFRLMSRMTDVFAGFTPISGTNPRDFHEASTGASFLPMQSWSCDLFEKQAQSFNFFEKLRKFERWGSSYVCESCRFSLWLRPLCTASLGDAVVYQAAGA